MKQLLVLTRLLLVRGSTWDLTKPMFPQSVEGLQGDPEDSTCYFRLFEDINCIFKHTKERFPWPKLLDAAEHRKVGRIVLLSSMTVELISMDILAACI